MGGVWALQIGFVTVDDVFNIRVPLFVILMSVLGGMRHWMGPVVGAVIIFTLTDRLNSAGLEDVNQVIIGGLLIILVLAVREGIFLRLLDRWKLALTTFVLAMAVWTAFDLATSLIWDFAYASLITLGAILLPRNLLRSESGPPAGATPQPAEASDRSPP
jgi:branched-chain amino acid transport system permease protein